MNLYHFGGKQADGKRGGATKVALDPGLEIIPNGSGLRVRLKFYREVEIAKESADKVRAIYEETLEALRRDRDDLRMKVQAFEGECAALGLVVEEQKRTFWNGLFWGVVGSGLVWGLFIWLGWAR